LQPSGIPFFLSFFGEVGLIMIVLEGSLDLDVTRSKLPMVGRSLLSSILILAGTSGLIYLLLHNYLGIPIRSSFIYAIPMAVISSAIAIPSVKGLSDHKKEFIVYESTFSDIIGIMVFGFAILDNAMSSESFVTFFLNIFYVVLISLVGSAILVFMLNRLTSTIKSFLTFAILILIYSVAKVFHLPALLLVLTFGVALNNNRHYIKGRLAKTLQIEKMSLFGYSMNIRSLIEPEVIITGSAIIALVLLARYIFLRFISKVNVIPEVFIAPRGLVTVVLFYSIPTQFITPLFNVGILYYVIIVSSIIMMLGLMFTKTKYSELDPLAAGGDVPLK